MRLIFNPISFQAIENQINGGKSEVVFLVLRMLLISLFLFMSPRTVKYKTKPSSQKNHTDLLLFF